MCLRRCKGVIGLICFFISPFAFSIGASCPSGSTGAYIDLKGAQSLWKAHKNSSKSSQNCALSSQGSRKLICQNKINPLDGKGNFFVVTGQEGDRYFIHNVQILDTCRLFDQMCGSIYQSKVYSVSEDVKPFMPILSAALEMANKSDNCAAFNAILDAIADPTIIDLDNGEKGLYFETGDTSCAPEVPDCVNKGHVCVVTSNSSSCGWSATDSGDDGKLSLIEASGSLQDYASGRINNSLSGSSSGGSGSSSGGSGSSSGGSGSSSGGSGSSLGGSGSSSGGSGSSSGGSGSSSGGSGSSSGGSGSSSGGSGSSSGGSGSSSGGSGSSSGGSGSGDGEGQINYPDLQQEFDIKTPLSSLSESLISRLNLDLSISGSCEPIILSFWGQSETIDIHCRAFSEHGSEISSAFLFIWSFMAILVILSA